MRPALGGDRTVMVVEDDGDCLSVVTEILELSGYRVVGVENGWEALASLRRGERPGLILLDLMMPVMDGFQFREAQLEDPLLADIPVIVFTAGRDAPAAARALGASDLLRKPVNLDDLLAKVARLFPDPSASARRAEHRRRGV